MDTPAKRTIEPLLEGLAGRIARRDAPPVITYSDPYEPGQFHQRLMAALEPLVPHSNGRGNDTQARMMTRFLRHETQTAADLADSASIERVAGSRAHNALVAVGLLTWERIGPRRQYRLSRWGEDWLLAIGRCEVPPARPVG